MKKIDDTTGKDIAYAAAKAVVGSIPLVGAAAGELLGLLVASPLEKRKTELLTDIGERLKDLEKIKNLDLETLRSNQQFIDTVLQATTYALKTSDREKLTAFKNAIINSALNESPDETVSQIFLTLIDRFTGWHIRLLNLLNDPEAWFRHHNRQSPNLMMGGLNSMILEAFPELKKQGELLQIIWDDLRNAGLSNAPDLMAMMSSNGLLGSRTTGMGRRFLQFIQE